MMDIALSLHHIRKQFHEPHHNPLVVLDDISLEIATGEFFVIVGPSGCGKSTLLRIMSGLETATSGHMALGAGMTQNDMSFVFQQFALLPWLTVFDNVALGLVGRGVAKVEREGRVRAELALLGLTAFAEAFPHALSGGMRQRAGIARALVTNPKIIFMDEPFSELDSFTAEALRQELHSIWLTSKQTVVMVTHLIPEALELADRIAVMTKRPGTVVSLIVNTLPRPRKFRSPEFYLLEDRLHALIQP